MSHELNFLNGRASMFSVREIPWHGLGTIVSNQLTSKEAIEAAQLNFKVEKGKAYLRYAETDLTPKSGKGIEVPNTFFTYRTDTGDPLSYDGKALTSQYQIIQNSDAFDFLDTIVGSNLAMYETAGALRKGETVFITCKLPEEVFVSKQDRIDQYFLVMLSHDGTSSVMLKFTPIRVVCNNTLQAALQGKGIVRIRHSSSYREKLETAKQVLGLASTLRLQLANLADAYANIKVDDREIVKLVCNTFLTKPEMKEVARQNFNYTVDPVSTRKANIIEDVLRYTRFGPGQNLDTAQGTLWGFVNGVTGYFQNSKEYTTAGVTNHEKKFDNLFNGVSANTMELAFNTAELFKQGLLTY